MNGERENTKIVIGLVAPPLVGQMVDMEPASTPAVLAPMPGALEGGLPALPPLRSAEIILWVVVSPSIGAAELPLALGQRT